VTFGRWHEDLNLGAIHLDLSPPHLSLASNHSLVNGGSILAVLIRTFPRLNDSHWRAQYGTIYTNQMDAKHDGRLIKFMHFSNRLCFYGIGLIGVLFLVAYDTSVTLFSFDSDLLPISGTLFALVAILFFSIDRTMESQGREIEITHRFAQVFFALVAEGQALASGEKRGHTRAAEEKIEELKKNLKSKITKAEKHLRGEWRFVVVSIVTVLLGFQQRAVSPL
jgi:hypothetical protein